MPYFVVHALDAPGKAAIRADLRPAHRQRLRDHDHDLVVHVGGPMLDEQGEMCGSMLVIEAADREAVKAYIEGDPYVIAGVYGSVAIHAYAWGLGQPEKTDG